ncbi:hypothetical protein GH714_038268 [Hevea brasiliensis]|uniref:DUF1664 domain-containing protein n=1 Tax=Hevea brasiliensis TaxID=3981 RepID=A0A6A6LGG9_HEVBR|nr:hypothetical protein GH714_038268 [Hevea brasiliensis]
MSVMLGSAFNGVGMEVEVTNCGFTGTVLFKNGKLSDLIGELQSLVKGLEKSGESADGDSHYSDAIAQQVKRLAMEVRQLASARQITVLNGSSGQMGNLTGLIVPATALGALGYGYMWWKGLKFSDLMYVTKRSMANAVSNLTKHLEQVSEALSAAKVHLTQRIQLLDDKMESQKEISKAIQNDNLADVQNRRIIRLMLLLRYITNWLRAVAVAVSSFWFGWEDRFFRGEAGYCKYGVLYLCNFVGGKKMKMPKALEDQLKPSGRARSSLTYPEVPSLTGLKELADNLSRTISEPTGVIMQDGIDKLEDPSRTAQCDQPRPLLSLIE